MSPIKTAKIDKFFKPQNTSNLVRLGDDFDGGYVVDQSSVEAADVLIALGVGDSWAFEEDCRAIKSMPLEAYDATISAGTFIREFAKSLVVFFNHKFVHRRWRILTGYFKFFGQDDATHHKHLVGLDQPPLYMSLETVLNKHGVGPSKRAFFKIDIEGWEYRILDTLVDHAPNIAGLAIEFHDFDVHQERIKDFITRFGLTICHIHCNNCAHITDDGQPMVVEISFTQAAPDGKKLGDLPNEHDMPNEKKAADYAIAFV